MFNVCRKRHWEATLLHEIKEVPESALEQIGDRLGVVSDVLLPHKCELRILDQLSETDHQAPWVWSTCLQALQEDLADLLLNNLSACVGVFSFSVDEQNDA